MQLEAKMKQRFSWMVLLLLTACLVHSSMAKDPTPACESGIVGTFSQPDAGPTTYESLTITPIHNGSLVVPIIKTDADAGIQIYLTLDDTGECGQTFDFKFDITSPDGKTTCPFDVKLLPGKLNGKDFDYADPYQGSFEVRDDGQAIVQTSNGEEQDVSAKPPVKCFAYDATAKTTSFKLKFDKPIVKDKECGVQFEMKGNYQVVPVKEDDKYIYPITVDGKDCKVEPPGTSNDDSDEGKDKGTESPATTTAAPFLWWYGLLIGLGALLLLVAIAAVIVIIVCCLKKKKSADEDLEAAPEDESDIQPAEQSTVVTDVKVTAIAAGAEPESGVDPTQQNASQNADDKPDDDDD